MSKLLASKFQSVVADKAGLFWSGDRHSMIGRMADQLLTEAAKHAVRDVLDGGGHATLGDVSAWADELRGNAPNDPETIAFLANAANRAEHARWHYLNLPFGAGRYDTQLLAPFIPADGAHVVGWVARCAAALITPTERLSRTNALRWLAHLVGDMHQPMHLGCGYVDESTEPPHLVGDPAAAANLTSDRGGNNILLPPPLDRQNLHSFWDGALSSVTMVDVEAAVAQVSVPAITAEDVPRLVVEWTNETLAVCQDAYWSVHVVARDAADRRKLRVEFGSGLQAYEQRNAQHVPRQMARAAVRLATLVNILLPQ